MRILLRRIRPPVLPLATLTHLYPSMPSTLLYTTPNSSTSKPIPPDPAEQRRKANMGQMIDYLRDIIPNALHKVPDSKYLDEEIILRVSSSITMINHELPLLKGRVSYLATLKATQFIMVNFLLNPRVKLHISDLKSTKGHGIKNGTGGDTGEAYHKYGLYDYTDKIIVKWRTCVDGCDHLDEKSSYAKQGSHILDKLDIKKLWSHNGKNNEKITGVLKSDDEFERIIFGIFVFELNKECDRIIVHSLENMEIFDNKDVVDTDNGFGNMARV